MSEADQFKKIINRSIKYLIESQNKDGSFYSFSRFDNDKQKEKIFTTFYTSNILISISNCKHKLLEPLIAKSITFLLKEKNESSNYNYWSKNFHKFDKEPCPNDLDDTACALAALHGTDDKILSEKDYANFTKTLISLESKEGGPYYTWIVPKKSSNKWRDIDLAVNANIGFFLSKLGVKLPNIDSLIDTAIINSNYHSSYYPEISTIYFISRYYNGQKCNELIKYIESIFASSKTLNHLEIILLLISLAYLDPSNTIIDAKAKSLLNNPFCFDSPDNIFITERTYSNNKRLSGCPSHMAALVIEFFSLHQNNLENNLSEKNPTNIYELKKIAIIELLNKNYAKRFPKIFMKVFNDIIELISSYDSDSQILLHPYLFVDSIRVPFENDTYLKILSVANTLGWMAYTIIDNISDEHKDVDKISLALIFLRDLNDLFCYKNLKFKPVVQKMLDKVDYANLFEAAKTPASLWIKNHKCIYNSPEQTAEKSVAHSLSSLAILQKLGFSSESKESNLLTSFYIHYLSARQINDDAHDWEDDLNNNKINYASDLLFFNLSKNKPINIKKDRKTIREFFWKNTIVDICDIIINQISLARSDLNLLDHIVKNDFLDNKLSELENAAYLTMRERNKTLKYIDNLF